MLFVSFTKGPGGFLYVFIITCEVPTLIPVDGITLGDHRVFDLREDQKVFDGASTFEMSLDPIPSTDLFDTFTKTLCVWYDYMTLTLNFSSGSRGTVGTLVIIELDLSHMKTCVSFIKVVTSNKDLSTALEYIRSTSGLRLYM